MSVRREFELSSNMNAWVGRGSLNFFVRSSESFFVKKTECLASGDQRRLFQSKDTIESLRALYAYIACYLAEGHVIRVKTKPSHSQLQPNVNVKLFKTVSCLRPMPDAYDWYGTLVMRKR